VKKSGHGDHTRVADNDHPGTIRFYRSGPESGREKRRSGRSAPGRERGPGSEGKKNLTLLGERSSAGTANIRRKRGGEKKKNLPFAKKKSLIMEGGEILSLTERSRKEKEKTNKKK